MENVAALQKMTVAELREALAARGIGVRGKKDELVARLVAASTDGGTPGKRKRSGSLEDADGGNSSAGSTGNSSAEAKTGSAEENDFLSASFEECHVFLEGAVYEACAQLTAHELQSITSKQLRRSVENILDLEEGVLDVMRKEVAELLCAWRDGEEGAEFSGSEDEDDDEPAHSSAGGASDASSEDEEGDGPAKKYLVRLFLFKSDRFVKVNPKQLNRDNMFIEIEVDDNLTYRLLVEKIAKLLPATTTQNFIGKTNISFPEGQQIGQSYFVGGDWPDMQLKFFTGRKTALGSDFFNDHNPPMSHVLERYCQHSPGFCGPGCELEFPWDGGDQQGHLLCDACQTWISVDNATVKQFKKSDFQCAHIQRTCQEHRFAADVCVLITPSGSKLGARGTGGRGKSATAPKLSFSVAVKPPFVRKQQNQQVLVVASKFNKKRLGDVKTLSGDVDALVGPDTDASFLAALRTQVHDVYSEFPGSVPEHTYAKKGDGSRFLGLSVGHHTSEMSLVSSSEEMCKLLGDVLVKYRANELTGKIDIKLTVSANMLVSLTDHELNQISNNDKQLLIIKNRLLKIVDCPVVGEQRQSHH